jgi:hypothetical protein
MKTKLFLILPAVILAGCTAEPGTLDALNADTSLTFEISGTADEAGNITYVTDGLGIAQESDVALPWRKTMVYKSGVLGVNISAQNAGSGTITCKIKRDGKVIAQNKSSGQYTIVTCTVS